MTTFFLDMDGVCTDFIGASATLFGKPLLEKDWTPGISKIKDILNVDNATFWSKVDAEGFKFWSEMPEYPWFMELYTSLKLIGDVVFCSSPSLDSNSFKGKIEWLQKRFGKDFRNYVFTNKKYYVSNYPDSILIDDDDDNIQAFRKSGGKGILFPQVWNKNYHQRRDRISYVTKEYYRIKKGV